jgi:DNA adenine methylase
MKTASPLRYPGGKSAMAGLLGEVRKLNGLGNRPIAEPFAGGAGASLTLLYLEETPEIHINDADSAIHAFWWTLANRPKPFLDLLARVPVTMDEWLRQRKTYRSKGRVSRLRRGFSAFFLNRCNRSGIITNGGPIGGVRQEGKWRLDARFNRAGLRRRCERVVEYRERIFVSDRDGMDFIRNFEPGTTFFFIDPPYFGKGPTLYLNALDEQYHNALADQLRSMSDQSWVLTYDDCAAVRRLYGGWARVRPFSLRYAGTGGPNGAEVLITPKWMRLPSFQDSAALHW